MEELSQLQTVILLLAAVIVLVTIARRVLIPYPIFLVLGGLGLSLVPNVPIVRPHPDVVFLIFLPPVLWSAAYFTSLRDFRANLRAIGLLAIGLVLATTAAVAAVARVLIPGLGWPVALALGAIVSPPDAVAAAAIARRLGIPHRVVTVLEGESLINDASALVLYRTAIATAVTGSFVLSEALGQFVLASAGGVIVGLLVGALARQALRRTDDSVAHTAITLLAPYAAWIIGERTHTSAVLACVAGGFYLRQAFSAIVPPATRLQSKAVWDLLVFILNGVIFILIGLHLGAIREAGLPTSLGTLLSHGALISATAIVVRLIWVPLAIVIPRLVSPSLRRRDPIPAWPHILLVAWIGMRGIVSLAAALALPATTAAGAPFPFRSEIIILTFAVILSTLVLQGLTLTPLIRALRLAADQTLELEEARAREEAAGAALARLDQLATDSSPAQEQIERLRSMYTQRAQRSSPLRLGEDDGSAGARAAFRRLRHETLTAERRILIALRDQGIISDDVLHRLELELDVEAMRIGLGEVRLDDGSDARA
jgi:monovalent cation/hydrogen antiporter